MCALAWGCRYWKGLLFLLNGNVCPYPMYPDTFAHPIAFASSPGQAGVPPLQGVQFQRGGRRPAEHHRVPCLRSGECPSDPQDQTEDCGEASGMPPLRVGYAPLGLWYAPLVVCPLRVRVCPLGLGYAPLRLGYAPLGLGYAPLGLRYALLGSGYAPLGLGYAPLGLGYAP